MIPMMNKREDVAPYVQFSIESKKENNKTELH